MTTESRTDRWQHLVQGAFLLDEAATQGPDAARAQAERFLESVLEVFPHGTDPLEDFEGYSVRRAAQALKTALFDQAARGGSGGR